MLTPRATGRNVKLQVNAYLRQSLSQIVDGILIHATGDVTVEPDDNWDRHTHKSSVVHFILVDIDCDVARFGCGDNDNFRLVPDVKT